MIVLNTEKGLIKIENWEDIETRPGFTKNLDPKAHTLDAIIGRYAFKDKIRCGLSNCHTPHAKGYVVVTKDGCETNIGKDCGQTYFGVDFNDLSRKFDRDISEKENREKLWSFSFRSDELKKQISDLRSQNKGANWIYEQLRPLVGTSKGCPGEVVRHITSMIKARQSTLTTQRLATTQEIENLEAAEGRRIRKPHYIDESIANIAGLETLYPENDLRNLLVIELEEKIKVFEEQDIDTLNFESLRYWAKWIGTIEATLDRALEAVSSGRRLLSPENLQPFLGILRDAADVALFHKYLKHLK